MENEHQIKNIITNDLNIYNIDPIILLIVYTFDEKLLNGFEQINSRQITKDILISMGLDKEKLVKIVKEYEGSSKELMIDIYKAIKEHRIETEQYSINEIPFIEFEDD